MKRSRLSSLALWLSALVPVLLLCASCGDETSGIQGARLKVKWGDLDAAERMLEGEDGARADEVRQLIASRRKGRAELREEIERANEMEPSEALERLRGIRLDVEDPGARELIDVAISAARDRQAEAVSSRPHATIHPFGYRRDQLVEPEVEGDPWTVRRSDGDSTSSDPSGLAERKAGGSTLDLCRAEIQRAIRERNWLRAWSEVQMALAVSGDRSAEFRSLSDQVLTLAQGELVDLLDRAEELDQAGRLAAACDTLTSAAVRFPHLSGLAELHDRIDEYRGRLDVIASADETPEPPPRPVAPPPVVSTGDDAASTGDAEPFRRALALELAGDLEGAMNAWLDAGFAALPGAERETYVARAMAIEHRLRLRAELAGARDADPEGFEADLGIRAIDADRVLLDSGPVTWSALPLDTLRKAAARAVLSHDAQLGLLDERMLRGDLGGKGGALASLADLVERGTLSEEEAWTLVARSRGEAVPEKGYAFHRGRWVSRTTLDAAALAEAVADLERKLVKASVEDREAVLAELEDLGVEAEPAIETAVRGRWDKALKTLQKGSVLSALERLATDRKQLDARRDEALELIFDEEEYFYPYRPPECPPQKARLYWPVQERVDELVAAVREVWQASRSVHLSGGFREALDELSWALDVTADYDFGLDLPAEFPQWIWALPTDVEDASLRTFAWTAAEQAGLRHDRAVLAYNGARWAEASSFDEAQRPGKEEQRQVEITNEYRMMLGRRALAWNPKIQEAARGHSDYMAATGNFGHFEEGDPQRRTPFDRMRLVGYEQGVSENCHMGGGSPEGAHDGWVHSSGHHRNILMPGHREMASGLSGVYWTQNFGVGAEFETDLRPWQD